MHRIFAACFLLASIAAAQEEAVDLGSRRELFVDRFLIEKLDGAELVLQKPRDEGTVMRFDKPWEGPFSGYVTVIRDGDTLRLFYRGKPDASRDGDPIEVTCCAESSDGVNWKKPEFGLFEVNGTRKNNVVLANASPATHNFSPFLDARPGVNPEERFKAFGGAEKSGLIPYVSADGIRWKRLREKGVITDGKFDSQNVAFWSESEQRYVCYFRTWSGGGWKGFRTVSRATSKDFVEWSETVPMTFGGAPLEHLYTNQTHPYFRAPHVYVAIAARFMPGRQVISAEQAKKLGVNAGYFKDCSDAVFMTSRGGNAYDRTFMEGFIRPRIGLENWVSRTNYPALNVVQTGPTEMSLYVQEKYAQPAAGLRRFSMRLDGFVALSAPYGGGEMVTRPVKFRGKKLLLNFAASAAGDVRVEIQDREARPLPGFALADCRPVIGNEIERAVAWKGGEDVGPLAGKPVRLRFVLKDAQVYSMRFE